jgi:hypothetical protein
VKLLLAYLSVKKKIERQKKEAAKELNSARVQEVKTHEYQDSGYAEEAAAIG